MPDTFGSVPASSRQAGARCHIVMARRGHEHQDKRSWEQGPPRIVMAGRVPAMTEKKA